MCSLETLASVIPHVTAPLVSELIVPTFVTACGDNIPNVKFTAARIIRERMSNFEPAILTSQLVPKLREMSQEADNDVAYNAWLALKQAQ